MRVINGFLDSNRKLCDTIECRLPQAKVDMSELYDKTVAHYMNAESGQIVVDIGGGKSCRFARYRNPDANARIIAVDICGDEMRENEDVDEKRVGDVTKTLPLERGEANLVVSCWLLEHLESLEDFVSESGRVLESGGYFIHLFPSKFAPFALINQALPRGVAKRILNFVVPESKRLSGFPAYYDNCCYSSIVPLMEKHGFEVVDARPGYHQQSTYFNFFVPVFLINALYEMAAQALGMKNLCAYILLVARKT